MMQVKGVGGATFKSFKTRPEAESFITVHASTSGFASYSSSQQNTTFASANNHQQSQLAAAAHLTSRQIQSKMSSASDNKDGEIYIDPQCQSISSYNTSNPDQVQLDKTKRSEGHIGAGLVSRIYAVSNGRQIGIYSNWKECEKQIKGFTRAMFKAFYTIDDAVEFITSNNQRLQKKRPAEDNTGENASSKRMVLNNTEEGNYDLDITVYFDGGSRGNPGVAGSGTFITCSTKEQRTTYHIRQYCGDKQTNNYAEYTGLIMGLKQVASFLSQHIKDNTSHEGTPAYRVRVFGDSNLVVQQVNGCWQCKNDNIRALYSEARTLYCGLGTIGNGGEITLQHVYREQNKVADGESMVYPLNPNSRSTHY
jgi:viroplasmin and RNaseH domain-containing protein/ribonuclease HI